MNVSRLALVVTLLLLSFPSRAAGIGWYYESFSWAGFRSYFGGGSQAEKLVYSRHLDELLQRERKDPFYNIDLSQANIDLWRSFIQDGLRYKPLGRAEARFADEVVAIVMGSEAELEVLEVRPETAPDHVHSGAFRHLLQTAPAPAKALLALLRFGRSHGEILGRTACFGEGEAWRCHGAYVILSPDECSLLGKELLSLLNSASFQQSRFEEKTFVAPLARALVAAGDAKRGIYLHVTD